MVTIKYVTEIDRTFWFTLDEHLPEEEFEKKVRDQMGYVLVRSENEFPVGLLRYNLFWDNTPFCTMLTINELYQGKGYGKKLMTFWEKEMKKLGFEMIMTSTQVDEEAQHFYRKMGFHDAGGLLLDIPGYEQPMELFLIKEIR